jgi:two-component system LytT family response regulator
MITCIVVDDDSPTRELLTKYIEQIPFLNLMATCDDALSANNALQEHHIDLIFMEIQMPGIPGIQFIESLVSKPMVIVVSADQQYALECYAIEVVDYLLKPVSLNRLMKACNKAKELFELRSLKKATRQQLATHTYLNAGYSILKIVFEQVLYIEGLKDYVKIHFINDKKPAVIRVSFKSLEEHWPAYFMRIHKSFIINANQIDAVKKTAILIGEKEIPLGEAYRKSLNTLINENRI